MCMLLLFIPLMLFPSWVIYTAQNPFCNMLLSLDLDYMCQNPLIYCLRSLLCQYGYSQGHWQNVPLHFFSSTHQPHIASISNIKHIWPVLLLFILNFHLLFTQQRNNLKGFPLHLPPLASPCQSLRI